MSVAYAIEPPRLSLMSSAWAGDVDTFIVSDLHLGLPAARPRDLLAVLEEWRFNRLILLGDVFHDWSFRHLCADTWRLLAHIRRLSHRREVEVVWVLGNHDRHLAHLVARLIGIETTETFRWSYDGRSFVALHGDRFDAFISRYARVSDFLSGVLRLHPAMAVPARRMAEAARPGACRVQQAERSGRGRCARLCQQQRVDVIVCGHTHRPGRKVFDVTGPGGDAIEYFNTGCWVERPASFVTVGAAGVALNHCP